MYNLGKQGRNSGKSNYIKFSESRQEKLYKWLYFPVKSLSKRMRGESPLPPLSYCMDSTISSILSDISG